MLTQSLRKAYTELSFARRSTSDEFWSAHPLIIFGGRGAARGLLGHLGSRKAYTTSIQSLYKAHSKQDLRKAYPKLIQSWYKAHARLTQSEHIAYAKLIQSLCKAYTKLAQQLILILLKLSQCDPKLRIRTMCRPSWKAAFNKLLFFSHQCALFQWNQSELVFSFIVHLNFELFSYYKYIYLKIPYKVPGEICCFKVRWERTDEKYF